MNSNTIETPDGQMETAGGGTVQNGWIGLILAYFAWNMLMAPALKGAPLIVAALS